MVNVILTVLVSVQFYSTLGLDAALKCNKFATFFVTMGRMH